MKKRTERIAWIEDDADLIYSIIKPLKNQGYVVDIYRTAQEAIDGVEQIRNSVLILLDLIIPSGKEHSSSDEEYEGVILLKTLRNQYQVDIPVIVLSTASSLQMFAKIADSLKVSDILPKPCLPSKLERSVLAILNQTNTKNMRA